MHLTRRHVLGAALVLPTAAAAQQRRNIRLDVPAAPGGAIDVIGRLFAQRLGEVFGQVWVVENRSGANNTVGAAEVARQPPDGATYLVNADIQLMAKHVMKSVPYDPVADFTPVGRLATAPLVLVGNPGATPRDLPALVAAMKASPDRFTFANSALGSMGHLATEGFKKAAGVDALLVSYRGTAPAITDLISGATTLMVAPLGSALPHIASGALRGFAVIGGRRATRAPEIPCTAELGYAGLDFTLWYAVWGPKGLPAETVKAMNDAIQAIGREPAMIAKLTEQGAEPVAEDAAAFARFIAAEAQRNAALAREVGIQPE
jgi:tripartite-type tricarboxylate transporter receptor subunit TctC